jgi:hypothetical protein
MASHFFLGNVSQELGRPSAVAGPIAGHLARHAGRIVPWHDRRPEPGSARTVPRCSAAIPAPESVEDLPGLGLLSIPHAVGRRNRDRRTVGVIAFRSRCRSDALQLCFDRVGPEGYCRMRSMRPTVSTSAFRPRRSRAR